MNAPQRRVVSQLRNVLASWGAFALSAAAGLFLSPFVVHSLGAASFGVWVLIGSLTGTLNIFDLGMRSAVIRFVAREHSRGEHETASLFVGTARTLFVGAGVVVLVVSAVLALGLPSWFEIPIELAGSARLILLISAAALAVVISNGLQGGIVAGLQRLDLIGYNDVALETLRIVLVLAVLSLGGGLVGLALIGLLQALLRRVLLTRQARQLYPELRTALRRLRWEPVRAILSVSAYSTLIYGAVSALGQASALIIGAYLPLTAVAYYAIGATLPTYGHALNRPIAQTVHPRASQLDAIGDREGLRALVLDTGRLSALVLLPLVVTFVFRGHTFVRIWMGDEFAGPAGDVLAILAVGLLFAGTRHVMQAAFIGSGRHRALGPWYLGEAIITIGLTIFVVPRWGIVGAAWAAVLPALLMTSVGFPWLSQRAFDLEPASVWVRFWLQPAIAIAPFAILSYLADRFWEADRYLAFFSQVAVLLPAAAIGAYLVGLTSGERRRVNSAVRSVAARVRGQGL